MKVLIIDDSQDALRMAAARLKTEDVEILCADGGPEGIKTAYREKPDLILLDVDMPELSGFDVCRALKGDPELNKIPVIFLTGSATPQDKINGLDLGAVDYVTKPFDAFELRARVRAALRTKRLQDLLAAHANIDALTGLANRRALTERLNQEWTRIRRYGGRVSFVMADIDHFKAVNDTYGHSVGDRLLREVAKAIASQCRKIDFPARYGGEEFGIVVPGAAAAGVACLAERCRRKVEEIKFASGTETIRATATFGVADTSDADSIESLIHAADEAMYEGKQAGRNTVTVASKLQQQVAKTPS